MKIKTKAIKNTMIPIFIMGLGMEFLILNSFKTTISAKKVLVLFFVVVFLTVILSLIPFVQKTIECIKTWIKELPNNVKKNKKRIIINIVLIAVVSLAALLISSLALKSRNIAAPQIVYPGMYVLSWTAMFILVFGIIYRKMLVQNVEVCVTILILLIGTTFIFAEPAAIGATWDEGVHYSFALNMSYDFERQRPEVINEIMEKELCYEETYDTKHYLNWSSKVNDAYENSPNFFYAAYIPRYNTLAHMPSAIIMLISRGLHLSVFSEIRMGKFGFLLVFAALIYASMKKLKGGKMLVATIALLPETLFLASNYSYDTWVIAWLILAMSCFIYELQHPNDYLDKKNTALMFFAFFIGVGPKALYIPLICILFLMPRNKFKSGKEHGKFLILTFLILVAVLATFTLPFLLSNGGGAGDVRGGSDVNSSAQTEFILHNLGEYLTICWNYFKGYVSFSTWSEITSFWAYCGHIPFSMTSIIMLMIVAVTDKCREDENMRWYHKVFMLCISCGITVLIITALYIAFTPVASQSVAGCQPRYLLPLFFPMLYCLGNPKADNKTLALRYRGIILSLSSFIVLFGIWTNVICRYF